MKELFNKIKEMKQAESEMFEMLEPIVREIKRELIALGEDENYFALEWNFIPTMANRQSYELMDIYTGWRIIVKRNISGYEITESSMLLLDHWKNMTPRQVAREIIKLEEY